jgi:hypothetical protein
VKSVCRGLKKQHIHRISSSKVEAGTDRQLKSGFETYEAAEKAAQEIKKRYPGPQVTVFDAKEHRHTVIEQPIASTKRRD